MVSQTATLVNEICQLLANSLYLKYKSSHSYSHFLEENAMPRALSGPLMASTPCFPTHDKLGLPLNSSVPQAGQKQVIFAIYLKKMSWIY